MISEFKSFVPQIFESVFIAPSAQVIGRCVIGKDSSIWFGSIVRGDVNYIQIGKRSNVQDLSVVHVTHPAEKGEHEGFPTIIGDDVTIGHKVMLHGCKIGNACLIGMSATLLDGCEIGEESIVAAGSLVTQGKKFPPRSLIMGAPAMVVRPLTENEIQKIYDSAQNYVDYKNEYLKKK
jgi:carbonic anhydrase/acetyltransferase-like protein (isoleucine patch superfamily)